MYIPTTFMSSQGSCFNVTTSKLSGSGSISSGSFISGGFVWDYYQFETTDYTNPTYSSFTASLNVLSGSTGQAKLLIVGAGGAGGSGATPNAINYAAGGGGGGGVVYYNNFPLSSGSFEIAVGGATTQASSLATGSNGRNSYFKLPNNITYAPFTSPFLTAFGGGGGGWGEVDGTLPFTCLSFNGTPSSTTGGVGIYSTQCGAGSALNTLYSNLGGISGNPQGYKGGDIDSVPSGQTLASGGGGAGAIPPTLTASQINLGTLASKGGDGLQFNLTGTPIYFSPGGGGQAGGTTGATGLGGDTYGRGGQGERDGNTTSVNFGFGGVVIIAIPRCATNLNICTEYRILGGATGGTITYIPCGTSTVASASINTGYTGSVCTLKVGSFPSSTGTVTLTQTGSCNSFIPLAATQSCASGTIQTPAFIYDWEVPIACYPTPSNCERYRTATSTINYVDYLGVSQSVTVGGGFGSNTGQICARELPTPTILCNTLTGGFGNCAITKTSLVCGYYCSGSV